MGNKGIQPRGIPLCVCKGTCMCAQYVEPDKCWSFASFGTWHICKRVCGYVSMSVEANSCLKCAHTCSQMNEAEGSELSCDSGSCQHCGACDVWAHPSLQAPVCGGCGIVIHHHFQFFSRSVSYLQLHLGFVDSCPVSFAFLVFCPCLCIWTD